MPWSAGVPDGNKNLLDNRDLFEKNFQYIEDNLNKDHFWLSGVANQLGHHRYTAMVTTGTDPAPAADPAVPAGTNGLSYVKTINDWDTDQAVPALEDKQVLHHNDKKVIRPLSFGTVWAYAVFNPDGAGGSPSLLRSSNIASVAYDATDGFFTFTFSKASPANVSTTNADYIVQGSMTRKTTGSVASSSEYLQTWGNDGSNLTTTTFKVLFVDGGGSIRKGGNIKTTQAHVMVIL